MLDMFSGLFSRGGADGSGPGCLVGRLVRLEVIGACKVAGFTLVEIQTLYADDEPGRPVSRALGQAKLAEIDAQVATLERARAIIEWGLQCRCRSIDACSCGIHPSGVPYQGP